MGRMWYSHHFPHAISHARTKRNSGSKNYQEALRAVAFPRRTLEATQTTEGSLSATDCSPKFMPRNFDSSCLVDAKLFFVSRLKRLADSNDQRGSDQKNIKMR